MKAYSTELDHRPPEWDAESSQAYVYHHTNIVEIEATEEKDAYYTCDVEKYTNREYIALQSATIAEQSEAIDEIIVSLLEV